MQRELHHRSKELASYKTERIALDWILKGQTRKVNLLFLLSV